MKKLRRFFCLFLSVVILTTSLSVYNAKKVQSAEWVAGAVATIGGAPILSALLIGGTVIAGGIAIYELASSTPSDRALFVNGVKTGFQQFVTEIETNELLQNNANITEAEAIEQATATATATVADFTDNVLNQTITTGKNLKTKTVEYWQRFSSGINDVADNGINEGNGSIGIGDLIANRTIEDPHLANYDYGNTLALCMPTYNSNNITAEIGGKNYIVQGDYCYSTGGGTSYNLSTYANHNYNYLYYIYINPSSTSLYVGLRYLNITNINNPQIYEVNSASSRTQYYKNDYLPNNQYARLSDLITNMARSSLPIIYGYGSTTDSNYIKQNWRELLAVSGAVASVPVWKRTINSAFENTHLGESIRTGRRQRINSGDYVGSVFQEDALPVKRNGLRVNNGVASGTVGWDIPDSAVWDGYLAGEQPFPRVAGDTGTVVVPKTGVTDRPSSNTVEWPSEADIYNPARNPEIGNPRPIGEPVEEIIEEQGGEFYPTAIDLTNIFPFCIPFDIAYCIGKFQTPEGTAPVIHIPIPIPTRLQGTIGQSYDVVIDFNNYIVLRNIIRYFILLFFIVALMGFTRNIIRG